MMNRMNILHSTGMPFPTKYGSFEKWLIEVGKQAQLAGNTVYISYTKQAACVDVYTKYAQEVGVKLIVLQNDQQMERFCTENSIDVVHFHFDFQEHDRLYRILRRHGIRLYATLHCECGYSLNRSWCRQMRTFIRIWGHRLKTWWRARYFKKILACSYAIEQQYRKFYGWNPKKIECLYLGIQHKDKAQIKKENDIPVISCIAFHSPMKGVDVLLKALDLLIKRGCHFRCLQIGGGSSETNGEDTLELRRLCTQLGLDGVVEWIGLTNNVNQYLVCSDIYCQPSRTEAICLSIAEAMECNLPVVASNVGGIPELVENGVNGWLVEPDNPEQLADKLECLLSNHEMRRKMGQEASKRLEQMAFYQNHSAQRIVNLYQ